MKKPAQASDGAYFQATITLHGYNKVEFRAGMHHHPVNS